MSFNYTASFANGDIPDADVVNQKFEDVRTLLNTTKLGDLNAPSAGQIIVCNGSGVPQYTSNPPSASLIGANAYRTITSADGLLWDTGAGNPTALSYLLGSTHGVGGFGMWPLFDTGEVSVLPPRLIRLVPSDYTVGTLTTKLLLRAEVAVNGTAPAVNYTFGLYPVTVGGVADTLVFAPGTVVTGSTVAISAPAANGIATANSGDFTFPADGTYVLVVATSGTMANNSAVSCHATLQVRNV